MASVPSKQKRTNRKSRKGVHHAILAVDVVTAAAAGAAMGLVGGPPGAAAGAIVGGSIGAVAGIVQERDETRRTAHDASLDETIGVTRGDLGAPNLKHPPPQSGAYSPASVGIDRAPDTQPAEGPISDVDRDG